MIPHCIYVPVPSQAAKYFTGFVAQDPALEKKSTPHHITLLTAMMSPNRFCKPTYQELLQEISIQPTRVQTEQLTFFNTDLVALVSSEENRLSNLHCQVLDAFRSQLWLVKPFRETWEKGQDEYDVALPFGNQFMGLQFIKEEYRPHVTLGKLKRGFHSEQHTSARTMEPVSWTVDSIRIASKESGEWKDL